MLDTEIKYLYQIMFNQAEEIEENKQCEVVPMDKWLTTLKQQKGG